MRDSKYYIFPTIFMTILFSMLGYAIHKDFEYKNKRLDVFNVKTIDKSKLLQLEGNEYYLGMQKVKALIELTEYSEIPSYNKNKILNTLNFEKDMLERDVIKYLGNEEYEIFKK